MIGNAPPHADERKVAVVQGSHRRDQRDAFAILLQRGDGTMECGDVTDDLHGWPASDIGATLSLRALAAHAAPTGKSQRPMTTNATKPAPHRIIFANEKGGTGKSTCAVHFAVALASQGWRVAGLDLDPRQRTFHRYLENRTNTAKRRDIDLPMPRFEVFEGTTVEELDAQVARMTQDCDYFVADTPGRDDVFARHLAMTADTLVTPINDSFIDFDLIGQVDPETFQVTRPSFYSELIWDTRKARAKTDGRTIDWIILRNRLQHVDAHNMRRVGEALSQLSRRVGFRVIPGLGERVIYRELFPAGLTLLDKAHLGGMGIGHVVARQELREAMGGLNLPARERFHPDGDLFAAA
jgi:chromosome partitioning protein